MRQLLLLLLVIPAAGFAQYRITLIVDKVPASTTAEQLYVAGNFNYWEPADENTVMTKNGDGKFARVFDDVPAGLYEFKITAGSNETVEVAADGKDISSRILNLSSDTTIHLTVARWKSDKTAFIENLISTWCSLQLPYYSLAARVKKPDGVISRFRMISPKS